MKKKPQKISILECYKKIRKFWSIKPQTKVIPNKKKKNDRSKIKRDLKKAY